HTLGLGDAARRDHLVQHLVAQARAVGSDAWEARGRLQRLRRQRPAQLHMPPLIVGGRAQHRDHRRLRVEAQQLLRERVEPQRRFDLDLVTKSPRAPRDLGRGHQNAAPPWPPSPVAPPTAPAPPVCVVPPPFPDVAVPPPVPASLPPAPVRFWLFEPGPSTPHWVPARAAPPRTSARKRGPRRTERS